MAFFRIKKGSLSRIRERIPKEMKDRERALVFGLTAWADDAVAEVQNEIQNAGAIDQGLLMGATTRSEPRIDSSRLRISVFNPLEYAPVVEFGRRPKKGKPPPLAPLIGWARRKGIIKRLPANPSLNSLRKELAASAAIIKNMGRGRGSGGKRTPLDPVTRDLLVVRLIARKIFEQGIAGRHPFTIAFFRKKATITSDVARMVELLT
jgi:hypothetical protein